MKTFLTGVLVCLALCLAAPAPSFAWSGEVVRVSDGDTIVLRRADGALVKVRLYGVDCPERPWKGRWDAQPYSKIATEFVKNLFKLDGGVEVAVWEMGVSYDRLVAGVILLDDGESVQEKLVRAGLAWVDPLHCKPSQVRECANWMRLEKEAVKERRGLWRDVDGNHKPVPPWKWRTSKSLDRRAGDLRHFTEKQ